MLESKQNKYYIILKVYVYHIKDSVVVEAFPNIDPFTNNRMCYLEKNTLVREDGYQ